MVLNQVDVAVVTHFARVLWKSPSLLVSRLTGKQGEELASLTTTTTTAANFRSRAYLIHTHTHKHKHPLERNAPRELLAETTPENHSSFSKNNTASAQTTFFGTNDQP